jgi:hypothetical protein
MIVEFKNTFHAPGFGRKRFEKGIVRDVPEGLRDALPSSAEILPDDYPEDNEIAAREEAELRAADLMRAQADTSDAALVQSGHAGWADESDPEPEEDDPPVWEFDGKVYKTEPAMKAAITRKKGR